MLYNHHLAAQGRARPGTVIAVEGYVDVIAMTDGGFPHVGRSARHGADAEQLALLWRMAEEPILCFDGDKAGRRAAYRAVDTALPLIEAGKSVRFALLPEGQDPDDLARSGGPAGPGARAGGARCRSSTCCGRARWKAGPLDTPERRAALEKRLRDSSRRRANEDLRRHYRAEIDARLRALLRGLQGGRGGGYREGRPAMAASGGRARNGVRTGVPEPHAASAKASPGAALFSGAGSLRLGRR